MKVRRVKRLRTWLVVRRSLSVQNPIYAQTRLTVSFLTWQFLKLKKKKLTMSDELDMVRRDHRRQIYGFIDFIVRSAIVKSKNPPL